MNDNVFKQNKLTPVCLSDFCVSLVACGDEHLDAPSQHHVDGCSFCQARLADESQQVRAQVYEPLPVVFMPKPQVESAWRRLFAVVASGAVCAAAAWVVAVTPASRTSGVRLKGGETSLSATVQRQGETVLSDEPLETMHTLREGDRLRLRLAGNPPAWVVVQGLESGAWVTYYKGAPPADGWLPFGIELTKDGKTRLRLLSCEKPLERLDQDGNIDTCFERLFNL